MHAFSSRELDNMTPEQLKTFIDGLEVKQIDQVFADCSFAAIKRAWEKYSGLCAVSSWSREHTIFQFKESKWNKRRTDLLLNGTSVGGNKVKAMNLGATTSDTELEQATADLVAALERLNAIKPIQFMDYESEYVYNYLGTRINEEDGRVYIWVSGVYDNLPSHRDNPLRNGRRELMRPKENWLLE